MIAVQVRDENVRYAPSPDLVFDHLYLGAFAAINQKIIAVVRHYLAGRVPVKGRYG